MKGRRLALALLAGLALALMAVTIAFADDGDATRAGRKQVTIGQQFTLTLEVSAPGGATVELDPANESWSGLEVVRVLSQVAVPFGDHSLHRFDLIVAGFLPGDGAIQPAVIIVENGVGNARLLPPIQLTIVSTLAADAPLELSSLPPTVAIDGAESAFLVPAVYAGSVLAMLLVALLVFLAGRWLANHRHPVVSGEAPAPRPLADLGSAESQIDLDPVGAYRVLAATVRHVIAERYDVPAASLTAREIQGRMESKGIDRWQARLVAGLLQECEAVVYAGYVPAPERRRADISMAREIIEGAAT